MEVSTGGNELDKFENMNYKHERWSSNMATSHLPKQTFIFGLTPTTAW